MIVSMALGILRHLGEQNYTQKYNLKHYIGLILASLMIFQSILRMHISVCLEIRI